MNKRILPLLLAASFSAAIAAPTAPVVVNGQATFAQQGNVFSITNTPNTIINWQSFNIAPGEITRFLQQNADSAVLNRITGQDPSQILGALQSNGHVFLINPNGIMFGKDARVDVNGLTASTLNISNADFIAGKRNFTSGGAAGTVSNQGSITTPAGGQVFLIASSVENSGIITSPQGQVVLAAGHTVQLVDSGNPDLHVVVSAPADKAINLGQVIAQGGRIGIYGALINQRGVVNANSAVVGANGKIVLKASGDTLLEQGSVTTATGAGTGGAIHLLGARVGLTGNAQVDASGAAGGGTVLVGGDYQGRNAAAMAHAQQTWLGQGASIKADATHSGNGGKVVLWSDTATSAFGSISARGGAHGGNGGLVETSGAALNVAGLRVNTLAARGQRGSWLLDPLDITVDATGSATLADVAAFSINDTASLTIAASLLSGAATDVHLEAKHDIAFEAPVSMSGHSLIARAGHDIRVNAPITVAGGSISMTAADTGAGVGIDGGAIAVNANLTATGGNIQLNAMDVQLGANVIVNSDSCAGECAVEFNADTVAFDSTARVKAGLSGANGVVSFVPRNPGRLMQFTDVAHRDSGRLSLTPWELGSLQTSEVNIGSSASTGAFDWALYGAYPGAYIKTMVIETAGMINIRNGLQMQDGGNIILRNYGGGQINVDSSGFLEAGNIFLRSDSMTLAGHVGTAATTMIGIDTASPGTAMWIGGTGAGLQLDGSALGQLTTANLVLGAPGRTGTLNIAGNTVFTPTVDSGTLTINNGTGTLNVNGVLQNAGANGKIILNSSGGDIIDNANGTVQAHVVNIVGTGQTNVDLTHGSTNNIDVLTASNVGSLAMDVHGTTIGDGTTGITTVGAGGVSIASSSTDLTVANSISAQSGDITLSDSNEGHVTVNSAAMLSGHDVIITGVSGVTVDGSIAAGEDAKFTDVHGHVQINGTVKAGRNVEVTSSSSVATGGAGVIEAAHADINITGNIGAVSAPLNTRLASLYAQVMDDEAVINVRNNAGTPGALTLTGVYQFGAGNGSVTVVNDGAMTLYNHSADGNPDTVRAYDGTIHLETHSPLTISGIVKSHAGNIELVAGDGGALSIASPGFVTSTQGGNVSLAGGTITAPEGAVVTTGTVTRSQTTAQPPPPVAPTVSECLAKPSADGCGAVLAAAKLACIANPSGPDCGALLPSLELCKAQPSTEGCSAVLPKIAECIATPSKDGCAAVLPNAATCAAHPDTLGCTVVNACLANPNAPGCGGLLPTLGACVSDKSLPGCDAVLPKLEQCRLTPNAEGCSVVLPAFALCKVQPSTAGCEVVLPSIDVCIGDKARDGCSAVLPQIGQCVIDKTMKGCTVVLPTLAECVVTPGSAGCSVVLPSIGTCIAQPATSGCQAVLPRIEQCIADPTRAGCVAVLPKIEACIAEPSRQGCGVILPTLAECVSAPTLQGCQVVLPTVAQCAANPNQSGCKAVIPSADVCTIAPNSALCQVLSPPSGATGKAPVDAPVLSLLNNATPTGLPSSIGKPGDKTNDKTNDKPADKIHPDTTGGPSSTANNEGGRDARAKTFCN